MRLFLLITTPATKYHLSRGGAPADPAPGGARPRQHFFGPGPGGGGPRLNFQAPPPAGPGPAGAPPRAPEDLGLNSSANGKKKNFLRNKMSWQSNKTKKPPCKSEVEDGEIVDEPSAKLKEISKSATSVTSIDIPKEIQKEDKLIARKEKLVPEKWVKADNSKNVKKPRLSKESFTDLTQDYADSSKPPADDLNAI